MKPAVFRLVLTAALFLGWLAYLAFLTVTRPVTAGGTPLVVSRPQILTSKIDIIAEIEDPQKPAVIREVLWPDGAPLQPGDALTIDRLADCQPLPRYAGHQPAADWTGQVRRYLVPLRPSPHRRGRYEVAPIPPSPGFYAGIDPPVRIYPASAETLAQYRRIAKPGG